MVAGESLSNFLKTQSLHYQRFAKYLYNRKKPKWSAQTLNIRAVIIT